MALPEHLPQFYRRPRVLDRARHGRLGLGPAPLQAFAGQANAVPLLAAELPAACRHLPIVFSTGPQAQPLAVLGLRSGENRFIGPDGQWQAGSYQPAYVRRYPFILLEDETRQTLSLCIDEAAPHLVDDGSGQPLFDATGQPSALTRDALALCRDYQAHHRLTRDFMHALAGAGVLMDQRAEISAGPGAAALALQGFQVVDEDRLQRLPDAVFLHWRDQGWLRLVYSHLQSLDSWQALVGAGPADRAG